jgi:hypothetical protein
MIQYDIMIRIIDEYSRYIGKHKNVNWKDIVNDALCSAIAKIENKQCPESWFELKDNSDKVVLIYAKQMSNASNAILFTSTATRVEAEIIQQLNEKKSLQFNSLVRNVAKARSLSYNTVRYHVKKLLRKENSTINIDRDKIITLTTQYAESVVDTDNLVYR